MASTPETSFSSDEGCARPSNVKAGEKAALFRLPSPQRSDSETNDDAHEAIQQAYQAIWDSFCGWPAQENLTFNIQDQQSYERLYQKLAKHQGPLQYFEDDLRKDWNATTGELTLKLMATTLHEVVKERLKPATFHPVGAISDMWSISPITHDDGAGEGYAQALQLPS